MRILLLDDGPYTLRNIEQRLVEQGHDIIACNSIYSANEKYLQHKDTIKCIIADLNMDPAGLSVKEQMDSEGGALSGWVWLANYVFKHKNNNEIKIIIYSEFDELLKNNLYLNKKQELLRNVALIPKSGVESIHELIRTINNIEHGSDERKEKNKKSVFLSYCSSDNDIMDYVENALYKHFGDNICVSRFTRNVNYRESFKEFMSTLANHDYIITIISNNYLKSHACMFEVGELIKLPDFQNKLLFIVLSDTDKCYYSSVPNDSIAANVYNPISRNKHVLFWKDEYEKLCECRNMLGNITINNDLNTAIFETKKILDNDIQQFLSYISDAKGIPFTELMKTDFKEIVDIIQGN